VSIEGCARFSRVEANQAEHRSAPHRAVSVSERERELRLEARELQRRRRFDHPT
jgi:hypothetical protein